MGRQQGCFDRINYIFRRNISFNLFFVMIKVNFNTIGQLVIYKETKSKRVNANFVLCKKVYQYSRVDFPTIYKDDLYIPRRFNYIQSIEHVKPTDL